MQIYYVILGSIDAIVYGQEQSEYRSVHIYRGGFDPTKG